MILTVIVFVLILSILVIIHEAGHFFVAKFFGIKVEEFGFGLPPRIFGIKRGETIYSLNWLPIGGFVKLYGEDEAGSGTVSVKAQKVNKKNESRAFYAKPVWQRIIVVFAGVFMNFVLAVAIISSLFAVVGVPTVGNKVTVDVVVKGTPADAAGLKVGDVIESVNGVKITSAQQLIDLTKKHLGESVVLNVKTTKGQEEKLQLTPRKKYPSDQGAMGVAISQELTTQKYPWYQAPFYGFQRTLNDIPQVFGGFINLVDSLITKLVIPPDVAGPIGIARITGEFIKFGPLAVLSLVYTFSLSLAIINVIPIPALDGGRILFLIIELITRKKINPRVEAYANSIGMAALLIFILIISLHDVWNIISGQPILPK